MGWLLFGIALIVLAALIGAYVYYDREVQRLEEEIKAYESEYEFTEEEDSP